jgi:hypothetical protein
MRDFQRWMARLASWDAPSSRPAHVASARIKLTGHGRVGAWRDRRRVASTAPCPVAESLVGSVPDASSRIFQDGAQVTKVLSRAEGFIGGEAHSQYPARIALCRLPSDRLEVLKLSSHQRDSAHRRLDTVAVYHHLDFGQEPVLLARTPLF